MKNTVGQVSDGLKASCPDDGGLDAMLHVVRVAMNKRIQSLAPVFSLNPRLAGFPAFDAVTTQWPRLPVSPEIGPISLSVLCGSGDCHRIRVDEYQWVTRGRFFGGLVSKAGFNCK